jgi:hypothetical protein
LGVPFLVLICSCCRIQTARLELEKQWAQAEREMGPQKVEASGLEPRVERTAVPVETQASADGSSVSHFGIDLVHQNACC